MRYLIAGHGNYAQGVYNTLQFFKNDLNQVDLIKGHDSSFEIQLEDYVQTHQGERLIVFTDLLGGSVNQAAMRLLRKYDFELIAGANIGLILELIFADFDDPQRIRETVEMGKQQVVYVSQMLKRAGHDQID